MKLLARLATSLVMAVLMACGGGGSTSTPPPPPPPTLYTITVVTGAGVQANPTSSQVEAGKTLAIHVAADQGYQIDSVTGCGGTLKDNVYTTAPIHADGVVTVKAKPCLYTVTASVGTGVHTSPTAATVEYGKTATFTLSLDAGFVLATASGCNGTLTGLTYTTGPVTSEGVVQFTAAMDIPRQAGKIAYVVAPDVLADMPTLLQSYMDAVATDTGCESVLIQSPADPAALRALLKEQGGSLRMAFLIGDIPALIERNISPYGTYLNVSDHYYRALDYPYDPPSLDASGRFVVDVQTFSYLLVNSCPTIAVTRIKGLSPTSQLGDIRRYLDRNLLLRGDRNRYSRGMTFISAATDSGVDGTKFLEAYQNHPLYGSGEVTFLGNTSAAALKQGFLDALAAGKEHCEANLHGAPLSVLFQGQSGDSLSMDAPEFGGLVTRAKVVSLASCSTGDFTTPGYLAGQILFGADSSVLLVRANPAVTLYTDSAFAREARGLDMALGVGRSYMQSYATTYSGAPPHFLGDPTITLRVADLAAPRPRLFLQEKRHHQEFREPLVFQTASLNGAAVVQDLVFQNLGEADLIINGNAFSAGIDLDGTFPWGVNSLVPTFHTPYIYGDPSIQTKMDGTYTFRLAPGASKTVRVEFTPVKVADGSIPVGNYHGVMFFSCNDPEIGSFRVDLTARTQ